MTAANRSLDLESLYGVKGQVALVTDVGGGGSREVAQLLAAAGAQVFIADRDIDIAKATLAKVHEAGGKGTALHADIEDEASVIGLFDKVVAAAGRLDILVNCAGMVANQSLLETTTKIWNDVLSLNLTANFLCMREGVKHMVAGGRGGRIVNITTIGARHAVMNGNEAYGAARLGVSALSRNTALDYAKDGILVNTVLAGAIMDKVATHPTTIEALKSGRQMGGPIQGPGRLPLGYGEMTDVAAAVLFLVSPAGRYITGHELALDGGFFVS
jgi:NAD(P)-dependent dehydrogenase (short-subunit alcohol dehydrogenase family)